MNVEVSHVPCTCILRRATAACTSHFADMTDFVPKQSSTTDDSTPNVNAKGHHCQDLKTVTAIALLVGIACGLKSDDITHARVTTASQILPCKNKRQ